MSTEVADTEAHIYNLIAAQSWITSKIRASPGMDPDDATRLFLEEFGDDEKKRPYAEYVKVVIKALELAGVIECDGHGADHTHSMVFKELPPNPRTDVRRIEMETEKSKFSAWTQTPMDVIRKGYESGEGLLELTDQSGEPNGYVRYSGIDVITFGDYAIKKAGMQ